MNTGKVRVKSLDDDLVERLLEYLKRNTPANILCIQDLLDPNMREKSEFRVALKGEEVKGFSLIYQGLVLPSLWIGGTRKSASKLARLVDLEQAVVFTWPNLAEVVKRRLPITSEEEMAVMMLERGDREISTNIGHEVVNLDKRHAPEVFEAFKVSRLPAPPHSEEDIRKMLERSSCYGIIRDNQVASFLRVNKLVKGYIYIGGAFTRPNYRRRRFATSVSAKVVSESFGNPDVRRIVLFAKRRNAPAMRLYQKLGFDVYQTLIYMGLNVNISLEG